MKQSARICLKTSCWKALQEKSSRYHMRRSLWQQLAIALLPWLRRCNGCNTAVRQGNTIMVVCNYRERLFVGLVYLLSSVIVIVCIGSVRCRLQSWWIWRPVCQSTGQSVDKNTAKGPEGNARKGERKNERGKHWEVLSKTNARMWMTSWGCCKSFAAAWWFCEC